MWLHCSQRGSQCTLYQPQLRGKRCKIVFCKAWLKEWGCSPERRRPQETLEASLEKVQPKQKDDGYWEQMHLSVRAGACFTSQPALPWRPMECPSRLVGVSSAHKTGGGWTRLQNQCPSRWPLQHKLTQRACSQAAATGSGSLTGRAASAAHILAQDLSIPAPMGAALNEGIRVLPPYGEACSFKKDHL